MLCEWVKDDVADGFGFVSALSCNESLSIEKGEFHLAGDGFVVRNRFHVVEVTTLVERKPSN